MRVRRCSVLFFEVREDIDFDLASLLSGSAGLCRSQRRLAVAPHLMDEVEVSIDEVELLTSMSSTAWVEVSEGDESAGRIQGLVESGLLLCEDDKHVVFRKSDEQLRKGRWWSIAALFQKQGRWKGVDTEEVGRNEELVTATGLRKRFGPPPLHVVERTGVAQRLWLPRSQPSSFDDLLSRRATCRNFDSRPLSCELFAQMLQRVFSAQAQVRVSEDTVFLKKTSPSGGGLHPTEAYLIVRNVEGVEPGLYHYHPIDHALEPLPPPAMPLDEFAKLALAGQHWFANAPALAVLTPHFARSFWKYRHHAKAYRALVLDSGHLSQTLYLSATELGLGAFVTSAINEIDIEQAFGLDPLEESPLAICGFGWRSERMETTEFDPAGEVWEAAG